MNKLLKCVYLYTPTYYIHFLLTAYYTAQCCIELKIIIDFTLNSDINRRHLHGRTSSPTPMANWAYKWGQIGPKWDKSGTF